MEGIHHVGVAVTDLDQAIASYETLFAARLEHREPLVEQGVEAASLFVGAGRVELMRPTGEGHAGRTLPCAAWAGDAPHRLRGRGLSATLDRLEAAGAQLVDEPRVGLFGVEFVFIHPDSVHGVLTEVVASG